MNSKEEKIDLKQRISDLDRQSLNGWVSFTARELSENNLIELAAMSDMLEKVGVSLDVTRKEAPESGLCYDFVVLKIQKEKYKAAMSRHAGRKADFEEKYDKYGKCTVAELEERLKCMPKTKIAMELGCSRMTLYRIIKNIKERNPSPDTSIWHYTS